jgi:hypothetical protein
LNAIHFSDVSLWVAGYALAFVLQLFLFMNFSWGSLILLALTTAGLLSEILIWLHYIIEDANAGKNNSVELKAYTFGFKIFLFTEAMLFFACFWAFVHFRISPNV